MKPKFTKILYLFLSLFVYLFIPKLDIESVIQPVHAVTTLELKRYLNESTDDHWSTTSLQQITSGYQAEGSQGYLVDTDDGAGPLIPMHDCYWSNKKDHFNDTTAPGCGSFQPQVVIGYIYSSQQPETHALYRCYKEGVQHFTSIHQNCEAASGYVSEGVLGYALDTATIPTPPPPPPLPPPPPPPSTPDTTPPTTEAAIYSFCGPDSNGNYCSGVTVILSCKDNIFGPPCSEIRYCTDKTNTCAPSGGTILTYPDEVDGFGYAIKGFDIIEAGTTYVRFRGRDLVGNVETKINSKSVTILNSVTKPNVDLGTACTESATPYSGNGVTISWTNPPSGSGVSFVDISPNENFSSFYNKPVSGVTTTSAPDGFNGYIGVSGPLTFTPGTTYYVRTFNGTHSVSTSFTFPACIVTISGKVFDKNTNLPVAIGEKIITCGADANRDPLIQGDGSFSLQLTKGDLFCIRGPGITGYTKELGAAVNAIEPARGYEWQVAGIDCRTDTAKLACQGVNPANGEGSKTIDRAQDTGYDIAYTSNTAGPLLQKIEISEDQTFPVDNTTVLNAPFNTSAASVVSANYTFLSADPDLKSIWVRYTSQDGTTEVVGPTSIELVKDSDADTQYPLISSISCSREGSQVQFTIEGQNLGQTPGLVKSETTNLDTTSENWTQNRVTSTLNDTPEDAGSFDITLVRFDGRSDTSICNLTLSQISVGASYFCPAIPNHAEPNVSLVLYDADSESSGSAKLLEKSVTINSSGIIEGLEDFEFVSGKKYTISIDKPTSLRRFGTFTAKATTGTTTVTSVKLPVGDIAPSSGDGLINTIDRSTLIQQWGSALTAAKTGDFNLDNRVNTFDWACMRFNFGEADQPIPRFPVEN